MNIIHVPYNTSVNLLLVMNGLGLLGRLIPGYFADRYFGPYNMLIAMATCSGVILYSWAGVHDLSGLYAFATAYGLFAAGFQGLFPTVLASLTTDMSRVGVRNGMGLGILGVAALAGTPLAGALIQADAGSYRIAQIFGASCILFGVAVLVLGRVSKTGWVFRVWV